MHCHCGIAIDIVIGIGIDIDVIVTSAEDSSEPVGKEQCCRQQNMNYVIVALTAVKNPLRVDELSTCLKENKSHGRK